jgi:hypothetical protein
MTRRWLAVIACLGAAACGGGDGGKGTNPAVAKTFTYGGTPGAAPAGAAGAASEALATAAAFSPGGAGDPRAVNDTLMAAADAALDGSVSLAAAPVDPLRAVRRVRARAVALVGPVGGELDADATFPRSCYVVTPGSVTFSGCTVTESTPEGTGRVTLSGTVSGAPGSVAWDLTIGVAMSGTSDGVAFTAEARYDDAGTFAVTETAAKAHQEVGLGMHVQGNGQSVRIGVAQAADLDATIAPAEACSTRITGGTFEAKRVWTELPAEARQEPEFRDRGVKLTWTGCGTATALFSAQ